MATEETIRRREYQRQRHIENREENNRRSREWYYAHREEVNTRHKERMEADPEYRARKRAIQRKADAKRYAMIRANRPREARDHGSREIDGRTVQTFTVEEAARSLGTGNSTIRAWLRKGDIPKPTFRNPILFTTKQIALMRKLKAAGQYRNEREAAKNLVKTNWALH